MRYWNPTFGSWNQDGDDPRDPDPGGGSEAYVLPEEPAELRMPDDPVALVVDAMPLAPRRAYNLVHAQRRSVEETAKIMGITVLDVRNLLATVEAELRRRGLAGGPPRR